MLAKSVLIRIVLCWSLLLSPAAATRAAEPAAVIDYLTPNSVAAATIRLADLATTEIAQPLPIEVADAALQKYLGIPLASVERITFVAEPPAGVNLLYAVVINTTEGVTLDRLPPELIKHTVESELEGRRLLESKQPMLPSIGMLDETTIGIGPKVFLKRLLKKKPAAESKLARAMTANGGSQNHLHAALMLEPLRGLIQMGMAQAISEAPPETHKYFRAIDLINWAILTADLSFQRESSVTVYANNESDGERLNALIEEGIADLGARTLGSPQYQQLANSDDPVQRATAQYLDRSFSSQVEAYKPRRAGPKAFVLAEIPAGERASQMASVAVIGFLVALLLPAVQAAREAARRNQSLNNMKQIALALHNHHDVRGRFPAQAICAADGTPLLSWRVAILPYVEQQALYDRFNLDEPWNSANNRPLLAEMPELFLDPSSPSLVRAGGKTHYLGVFGADCFFDGGLKGISFRQLIDGTSRTMAAVQVDDAHAVEWTKPSDYRVEEQTEDPLSGIGSLHPGVFLAIFADGHVQPVPISTEPSVLKALFTRNGREVVELP